MARTPLFLVIKDPSNGRPIRGATVTIRPRDSQNLATIYRAASGLLEHPNPSQTNVLGEVEGWIASGRYDAHISAIGYVLRTPYSFDTPDPDIDATFVTDVALADHAADGTAVHGIADSTKLITETSIVNYVPVQRVFIQSIAPNPLPNPAMWWELNANGTIKTLWINT